MDCGWFMMPFHPPRRSCADAYDRDTAFPVQADQLGSHEAWMGEHSTETWENAPVPELRIATALALTERLIAATGVTMLPLHHPVETAHRIAMLDHMALGRFSWGIDVRSLQTNLHLYGVDYTSMDDVWERGKEALEVILGLWQAEGGHFDFKGKYSQVHAPEIDPHLGRRLYSQPYQKPHPPIGVAASTPHADTMRLAGARGWIPMTHLMAPHVRTLWEQVEAGAASTGRTADRQQLRLGREVSVGEPPASTRAEARLVLGRPCDEHQYRSRQQPWLGSRASPSWAIRCGLWLGESIVSVVVDGGVGQRNRSTTTPRPYDERDRRPFEGHDRTRHDPDKACGPEEG